MTSHVGWATIDSPKPGDVECRSRPMTVKWQVHDTSIPLVMVLLNNHRWDTLPDCDTEVVNRTMNNGEYTWPSIPWGIPPMEGYYIKLIALQEDGTRAEGCHFVESGEFEVATQSVPER